LLGHYNGYLNDQMWVGQELGKDIERKKIKGPTKVSINELRQGAVWTCEGYLPQHFLTTIPSAVKEFAERKLNTAQARETWGGKDVIEIG